MSDGSSVEKDTAPRYATNAVDERRRAALAEVDNAKFSWFHVKVTLVAGVGFFTDACVLSSLFLLLEF